MLNGPGGIDEIKPRKNRLLHRRKKHLQPSPINRLVFTVVVATSVLIGLPFIIGVIGKVRSTLPDTTVAGIDSLLLVLLFIAAICLLAYVATLIGKTIFRPLIGYISEASGQYRDDKERRERHWRHYMKKISRVEREIAAGADYKVGADGELIVVKNHDKTDSDSAIQITDDGEVTSKKDKA